MDNVLQKFMMGRSGSSVSLVERNDTIGVLKNNIKDIDKTLDVYRSLPFSKPEIYTVEDDSIFMEYIPGITASQLLYSGEKSAVKRLLKFIIEYIDFSTSTCLDIKDYSEIIDDKIREVSKYVDPVYFKNINTEHCQAIVHGDFTFDNILYYNHKFYLIDINYTPFNSPIFDINKLRQDLTGYWFMRHRLDKASAVYFCKYIVSELKKLYPDLFDDAIYRLMIARVLPYVKDNDFEYNFIKTEIKR